MWRFDRVVMVDWSANSTPKLGRDSIWIAQTVLNEHPDNDPIPVNVPTRRHAIDTLLDIATAHPHDTTLVGVDFGVGYPTGTAAALGLSDWWSLAHAIAERIVDGPDNANNRFGVAAELNAAISDGPGPWWGCPPTARTEHLSSTKAPGFTHRTRGRIELAEFRLAESIARHGGHRVQSQWQLLGAGSVGSQSLTGIAALLALKAELGDRLLIWPFDTDSLSDDRHQTGHVVVAETWPGLWPVNLSAHPIRDAAQVIGTCKQLRQLQADGLLNELLAPVHSAAIDRVRTHEGWILGVSPPREGSAKDTETDSTRQTRAKPPPMRLHSPPG
jgi:hypothetical protein